MPIVKQMPRHIPRRCALITLACLAATPACALGAIDDGVSTQNTKVLGDAPGLILMTGSSLPDAASPLGWSAGVHWVDGTCRPFWLGTAPAPQ